GSGTHIGNGYIISAAHVVGGRDEITIKTDDGEIHEAETLWLNTAYDLALIRMKDYGSIASANLACRVPQIGETITARGNPLAMEFITVWGKIAGKQTEFGPWKSVVITDIATVPGQSGGGVYDQDGNLVGVTVGVALAHVGYTPSIVGLGYIVSGRTVCNLLARG